MEEPSSFWNAFGLQPGSTTITDSGRQSSSAPRARIAAMMRLAWSSVIAGMCFLRAGPTLYVFLIVCSALVLRDACLRFAKTGVSKDEGGQCGAISICGPWFETPAFAMRRRAPHHEGVVCGARRDKKSPAMIARANVLTVDRLVKVYKTTTAVAGISFALEAGTITGLLGGNGAGKTTTIAMIIGLVEPTAGRVTVLGADMPRQRYRVLHRMNFESPYIEMPRRLTVRQNLIVFAQLYGVADIEGRIRSLA